MKSKRLVLSWGLAWAATALFSATSAAQSFPTGPVKILVASAAGGSLDALARIIAQGLGESMGQPFVVEPKPGAGGNLAIEAMLKSPADGHTLLFSGVGIASNLALYKNAPYALNDITAVSVVGEAPLLIMVNPSVPANTLGDLVALLKAQPGSLQSAVLSGGSSQFASDMFRMMAKVNMPNLPYKGGTQIFSDLIGGHVKVAVLPIPESMPHVNSKRVRALAQTGTKRSALAPAIPTAEEAGIPGCTLTAWYMVSGSSKMPPAVARRLNEEIGKLLKQSPIQQKIAGLGIDLLGGDLDQAAAFLKSESEKFASLVKFAGAKVE